MISSNFRPVCRRRHVNLILQWNRVWKIVTTCCVGLYAIFIAGCGDPGSPDTFLQPSDEMFWSLELNHRAINLALVAPYDTVTLIATPRNVHGDVLTSSSHSEIESSTDLIAVLPNSVIRAVKQTGVNGNYVVASMTINGVTRRDSARVVVTSVASPPKLKTFSIQLPAGDSTRIAAGHLLAPQTKVIKATVLDSMGNSIPRAVVDIRSDNLLAGTIAGNTFTAQFAGKTMVRASALIYGIAVRDSLEMTVTDRLLTILTIRDSLAVQRESMIAPGGQVYWNNLTNDSLDIVFDEPEKVEATCCTPLGIMLGGSAGNIAPWIRDFSLPLETGGFINLPRMGLDNMRGRLFSKPGRYKYHSTKRPGIWGTIVVRP